VRRRDVVAFLGGAAVTWLRTSQAQQKKVWRIGQVLAGTRESHGFLALALEERLSELGDKENVVVIDRFARPEPKAVQEEIAAVSAQVDMLVVYSTIGGVAAKRVAPPVPVVFVGVGAPLEIGLVQSLSHPGGNMTGVTFEAASETYQRRLQLLKELVPNLTRVAVLRAHGDANAEFATSALEKAAPQLGVRLMSFDINPTSDLDGVFAEIIAQTAQGLIVVAGALTFAVGKRIAELALAHRLPSCGGFKEIVKAGELIGLGPDLIQVCRQGAGLVDKIIHGRDPADLPVEQPTRYMIWINLKTASALGLTVPLALLAGADEVIE
jgi:putative tryptophan/tyrosine transport system substrate-binding protein